MFRKKKVVALEKLDKEKILSDIRKHFAEITPEEFLKNVKRACPELFWDENEFPPTAFTRAVKRRKGTNHTTDSST